MWSQGRSDVQSIGWDQVQHPGKETAPAGTEQKEARLRRAHPQSPVWNPQHEWQQRADGLGLQNHELLSMVLTSSALQHSVQRLDCWHLLVFNQALVCTGSDSFINRVSGIPGLQAIRCLCWCTFQHPPLNCPVVWFTCVREWAGGGPTLPQLVRL